MSPSPGYSPQELEEFIATPYGVEGMGIVFVPEVVHKTCQMVTWGKKWWKKEEKEEG